VFLWLTNVLLSTNKKHSKRPTIEEPALFQDVVFLLHKFVETAVIREFKQTPEYRLKQYWDPLLKMVLHLLYLAEILPKTFEEQRELCNVTKALLSQNPCDTNENTLLHLAVVSTWMLKPTNYGDIECLEEEFERVWWCRNIHRDYCIYSSDPSIIRMLLRAGAPVDAVNQDGSTALHLACLKYIYREDIVTMLLDAGAHIDRTNHKGDQPYRMLGEIPKCQIKITQIEKNQIV